MGKDKNQFLDRLIGLRDRLGSPRDVTDDANTQHEKHQEHKMHLRRETREDIGTHQGDSAYESIVLTAGVIGAPGLAGIR